MIADLTVEQWEVLKAVAQTNTLPTGHQWPEVQGIVLQATKRALQAAATVFAPPTDEESKQFAAENIYLAEQLELFPNAPFTLQRLCEILCEPSKHHATRDGRIRGEVLQSAIRRCVLVSAE